MHAAPPVSYPAGRSRAAAFLLAVLSLAGLAVVLAWTVTVAVPGWRQAAAWAAWLVAVGAAWRAWFVQPVGLLRWNGGEWEWSSHRSTEEGHPAIVLDLQACLLVKWRPAQGRVRWLWLDRASASADWLALRRAVYSPARTEAPDGAKPPMAQR